MKPRWPDPVRASALYGTLPDEGTLFVLAAVSRPQRCFLKKLFIGNLAFGTTSEDLSNLCSQFGEVSTANVVMDRETGRSRGFAFVEMNNGGDQAVQALNQQDFQGRSLTVNEAKPREDRPRSSGGSYGGGGSSGGGYGGGGGGYGNR